MTKPTLSSFNTLAEIMIQTYERYLPTAFDESMTILEKMNKIIKYLNETSKINNDLVKQWNEVMEWVMNEGLSDGIKTRLDEMVLDGSFDTIINQTVFNGLNNRVKAIGLNPDEYKISGETDYSNAFTRMMDEIKTAGRGTIILDQGKVYTGTLLINTSNVTVKGKGTLKGLIKIEGEIIPDTNQRYSGTNNISIEGINIDGETLRNGITIQHVYDVVIDGCYFRDCLKAITVNTLDYNQHVSRLEITKNKFRNCQYAYFVDQVNFNKMICGDVTFNDNVDEQVYGGTLSRIATIHTKGQDGIIINGNTMFGVDGLKKNIYIENSNFVVIASNNLFSAEENAIHVVFTPNITITGNNIAWAQKDAILLDKSLVYTVTGNTITWFEQNGHPEWFSGSGIKIINQETSYGTISGNTVLFPYKYGIEVLNSGQMNISSNTIRNIDSTLCGIYVLDGSYVYAEGNVCLEFPQNNQITGYNSYEENTYYGKPKKVVESLAYSVQDFNSSSVNLNDVSVVIFNNSLLTTVNSIIATDMNTPRKVTFYSYNGNTEISRSTPNVLISGNAGKVVIQPGGSMEFLIYGGNLIEVNRNNVTEV